MLQALEAKEEELKHATAELEMVKERLSNGALLEESFRQHPDFDGFAKDFSDAGCNLFIKSWAHICKLLKTDSPFCGLPQELTPAFERGPNILQNPFDFVPKDRSLSYNDSISTPPSDWVRASFELTPTHIQKLKKRVLEEVDEEEQELHLSTFVVGYAYVLTCTIKAKKEECKEHMYITLAADVRGLLDPPVSSNYFGNCIIHPGGKMMEATDFANMAKKISHLILDLTRSSRELMPCKRPDDDDLEHQRQRAHEFLSKVEVFSVAASPKYKLYETDFGWGNPIKLSSLRWERTTFR
ncbi:BAHD acyltransferase At3g29680-like [Momordica charantia]|uniref:BAHD acyltransferase At3g29680-like n=1 Tax=Momordica charantia TaxID=3673 RepID=A0A6J1BZP0_MOMCH|nr:BAHD acyltransferase At3g29680-like [Momordica charantia]